MAKKTTYNLDDKLPFGKNKGKTIRQIMHSDANYLQWCLEKLDRFAMSEEAWDYAVSVDSQFATMRPKPKTTSNLGIVEQTMADGIEILAHYPWRDVEKAKNSFLKQIHQIAEDAMLVVEPDNLVPVQLTLF